MNVFRVCRNRHAGTAFSGEGARLYGARWNPAGVPLVYTSLSLSLAMVELFVHLDAAEQPDDLVTLNAELPVARKSAERIDVSGLPKDWRRVNHPALRKVGAEWALSARSLTLLVPSAVVDGEWNVLVNPAHPDAKLISISKPRPLRLDARMFRNRG